ncbi:hypothetical protein RHI9324_05098 [Rhizobium sp. CECT 9324]|nr:hypothetical protein RHI9324_05098 [Rhizobium sp. CECT 9324]
MSEQPLPSLELSHHFSQALNTNADSRHYICEHFLTVADHSAPQLWRDVFQRFLSCDILTNAE